VFPFVGRTWCPPPPWLRTAADRYDTHRADLERRPTGHSRARRPTPAEEQRPDRQHPTQTPDAVRRTTIRRSSHAVKSRPVRVTSTLALTACPAAMRASTRGDTGEALWPVNDSRMGSPARFCPTAIEPEVKEPVLSDSGSRTSAVRAFVGLAPSSPCSSELAAARATQQGFQGRFRREHSGWCRRRRRRSCPLRPGFAFDLRLENRNPLVQVRDPRLIVSIDPIDLDASLGPPQCPIKVTRLGVADRCLTVRFQQWQPLKRC
jgi:hypothetical protein